MEAGEWWWEWARDVGPVNSWWNQDRLHYKDGVILGQGRGQTEGGQASGWKDLRCCCSEFPGEELRPARAEGQDMHVNE